MAGNRTTGTLWSPPDSEDTVSSCHTEILFDSPTHSTNSFKSAEVSVHSFSATTEYPRKRKAHESSGHKAKRQHTEAEVLSIIANVHGAPHITNIGCVVKWGGCSHDTGVAVDFSQVPSQPPSPSHAADGRHTDFPGRGRGLRPSPWNQPCLESSQREMTKVQAGLNSMDWERVKCAVFLTRRARHTKTSKSSHGAFYEHNALWPGRVMADLDFKNAAVCELHCTAAQQATAKYKGEDPPKKKCTTSISLIKGLGSLLGRFKR